MHKKILFLPTMALTLCLTIGCGEKEPPAATDPSLGGGALAGGGLQPLEPLDGGGGLEPIGGDPGAIDGGFNPEDNFVDPGAGGVEPGVDPGFEDPGAVDPGAVDPGAVDPGLEDPGAVDPGVEDPGDGTFVEDPEDPTAEDPVEDPTPTTPTELSSTSVASSSFTLNWTGLSDALSYNVYQDGVLLADNVTGLTHDFTGLTPETSYSIEVSAVTAEGESAKSEALSVTTAAIGAPSGLASSSVSPTGFTVSWTGEGDSYKIYLNGAFLADNITAKTYTFTALTPGTSYSVEVSSVTAAGESAKSPALSVSTSAIPVPTALKSANVTASSFDLSWTAASGATSYKVFQNDVQIADSITGTSYQVTGLNGETTYSYKVVTVTADGESAKSAALQVTTPDPFGNKSLGFVNLGAIVTPKGLDVKNGRVYVSHIVDGTFSNTRYIRDFNLSNGQKVDHSIFSTTTGLTPLVNGIAVNGGVIWSTRSTPDGSGFNLYKHNASSGDEINKYKVGNASTTLNDIAVDIGTGLVYMASPTTNSIIKYDENNSENTQLLFSGAANINPIGLGVGPSGHVYATDANTGKVIKFSKTDGSRLLEFDGKGVNSTGEIFSAIGDVAVDPRNGDIYVVGSAGGTIKIFRYNASGNFIRSITNANLTSPEKMSIGNDGVVYIVDASKKSILAFTAGITP